MKSYSPVALLILDGWGIREMEHGNGIKLANTPNFNRWLREKERSIVDASGEAVGLVPGQMGNSEVGHLNLGAGFIVYQNITRIDKSIEDGSLAHNPMLLDAMHKTQTAGHTVHLIGLVGPGGVHSHTRHLLALLNIAQQQGISPVVHVITDGRDTPPNSGREFVADLEAQIQQKKLGRIATVSGRYYAMDRDKRWERTKKAYDAIIQRSGESFASAVAVVEHSYQQNVTDEFIVPALVGDKNDASLRIQDGDCVICFNFRADRMRQIVTALVTPGFSGFDRGTPLKDLNVITMTQYDAELPVQVLFPPHLVTHPVARIISEHGMKQFHAAETEKYPHVTYFFNGGREEPFPGEERQMAASPKVATYDLKPEMSAYELTEIVLKRLAEHDDNFLIVNYANPDMVGHTGVLSAAIKAVETVDECANKLVEAILQKGGAAIVTADHGNAERMIDELTGTPHTYHTTNPVSLFVLCDSYMPMRPRGILADVSPTILHLLGLPQPEQMTGKSLVDFAKAIE
ncbi:MAG: 2,3-bisphosphoglycerate-independent phosphoglycerate mutase [Caldilineaceae bacterium]